MDELAHVADDQLRTLDRLRSIPTLAGFYLAGGTAIAFHLGHRRSLDLDLFSATRAVDLDVIRDDLAAALPDLVVIELSDVTLSARVGATPIDVVRYRYPPLEPPRPGPSSFPVAGLRDLAAMKLAAIARRGIRRDFWDLREIARGHVGLRDAGAAYLTRFGVAESNLYHVLRALTFFEDAERDGVYPAGLTAAMWAEIKEFFVCEAPALLAP